jgi:complex III assembly factor LYRM7
MRLPHCGNLNICDRGALRPFQFHGQPRKTQLKETVFSKYTQMAALTAYRQLMRAARIAFEGTKTQHSLPPASTANTWEPGDVRTLDAAKQSIRQGFRDKASLSPSDPSIQPAIQHAQELASFLKANLVQGKREEGGLYSMPLPWHHIKLTADQFSARTPHPRTYRTRRQR